MTIPYTENLFATRYKDDFNDSDHYHRILFNSGRALQARELTQMQTIIQKEIERFGRNIFQEGASVVPGGMTVNNRYDFVKLDTSTYTLPTLYNNLVSDTFTGQSSGVIVKVIEVLPVSGSDPATLYVSYTSTSSGTSGTSRITLTPGETIVGTLSGETLQVQLTNTSENPAVGFGTRASVAAGTFFTQGHFVQADPQSIIVSRYTTNPTDNIVFKVVQDVVTFEDEPALYDNQGVLPNTTSPGADRYRIRLQIGLASQLAADENSIFMGKIDQGSLVEVVKGDDQYNKIEDHAAKRIQEINGDFIKKPFRVKFNNHPTNDERINIAVSPGIAYINGYRAELYAPTVIDAPRAYNTISLENNVSAANFGNYIVVDGSSVSGLPNIDTYQAWNLRSATGHGGSTIGTARVKSVEEDGANYRYYLMDIQMNAGQNIRSVKSIGIASTQFANLILENGIAVVKVAENNNLLFSLPYIRPKSLSDISFTVQRRLTATTDGSGNATFTLTTTGETFADVNDWVFAEVTGAIFNPTVTGAGTQSASITGGPSSTTIEVLAKVNKASPTIRTKTKTETTVTTTITTPASGSPYIDLGKADIFKVKGIKLVDSAGDDISNRFIVDNGQRDNFYDVGRLILKSNATAPSGNVHVRFQYLSHGAGGDFFAINSYSGQLNYPDIPVHTLNDGTKVPLTDVLDFRSRKDNAGAGFSASTARHTEIPQNTSLINFDVDYYLPRFDKLVVDTEGVVALITGVSALKPQFPETPENTIELYRIRMNPATITNTDMKIKAIEAKGYTMRDINKIEEKLENLQEVTALSLLETDLRNFSVLDSSDADRTKSGFLVDNFSDQRSSATSNVEYRSSIDPRRGIMRASFNENNIRLIYDSDKSTNTVMKGDNVYIKYSETLYLNQLQASQSENINPFAVVTNKGFLRLSPSSDEWKDTRAAADRIIDGGTRLDTDQALLWNNWQWNWSGSDLNNLQVGDTIDTSTASENVVSNIAGNLASGLNITTDTFTTTTVDRVVSSETIREVVGTRVIDVALVPFMRSRKVYFRAQGMQPNTRHFAFFDGVDVNDWVKAETFQTFSNDASEFGNTMSLNTGHPFGSSAITSNSAGEIEGSFFIPNTANLRFRTGVREFKLLDVTQDNGNQLSSARAFYTAQGTLETIQTTIRTTRQLEIAGSSNRSLSGTNVRNIRPRDIPPAQIINNTFVTNEITAVTNVTNVTNNFWGGNNNDGGGDRGGFDPLAQSFFVDRPTGVFITKVGIYFETKDSIVPVQCQIRPLTNGTPDSNIIVPGAVKFLAPSAVNVSADASLVTYFEFDEPVFLNGQTDYAIVLLADSVEYKVFIAETEKFELGSTEKKISKQPTLGSLFKSQNSKTWDASQTQDMMFEIYRSNFEYQSATAVFENAATPRELLVTDPFTSTNSSSLVEVFQPHHGFVVGDTVKLYGLDSSTTYASGITGANIMGDRTITAVDENNYKFTAGASATSTTIFGGTAALATQNMMYETLQPSIMTLIPQNTFVNGTGSFISGKSLAGQETAYLNDPIASDLAMNENNFFEVPKMIAADYLETANLTAGTKSARINVGMFSSGENVSPVIDTQRCSLFLIHNNIDLQDSANSADVLANRANSPINFADETTATGGTHLAKHVVKPVQLAQPAVGLKILIAANRPSVTDFDVYYKATTNDVNFEDIDWTEVSKETPIASDDNPNIFRDYTYLVGAGTGLSTPFTKFIIKIVQKSSNSAKVVTFKDLRVIALAV